jgi:hypothetical protein
LQSDWSAQTHKPGALQSRSTREYKMLLPSGEIETPDDSAPSIFRTIALDFFAKS